jgi:hypothetical protein
MTECQGSRCLIREVSRGQLIPREFSEIATITVNGLKTWRSRTLIESNKRDIPEARTDGIDVG